MTKEELITEIQGINTHEAWQGRAHQLEMLVRALLNYIDSASVSQALKDTGLLD